MTSESQTPQPDLARPEQPRTWRDQAPPSIDLSKAEGVTTVRCYYGPQGVQTVIDDSNAGADAPIDANNAAHVISWAIHQHLAEMYAFAAQLLMQAAAANVAAGNAPSGQAEH